MLNIFLWNNYHNGDIITCKPLVWELVNSFGDQIKIAWGCFKNHTPLLTDLPITIYEDPRNDDHPIDLSYLCPPEHHPLYLWLGQYSDTKAHNWPNQVEVFNRQCNARGVPINIVSKVVPAITFDFFNVNIMPRSVYIENGHTRSGHSDFEFRMDILGKRYPNINFYCTAPPKSNLPNLFDCSHLTLPQLSACSNKCNLIIGKGSGPFLCTLTHPNQYKPKAVIGYKSGNGSRRFWDYPGNPLQYLNTNEELFEFIEENINKNLIQL